MFSYLISAVLTNLRGFPILTEEGSLRRGEDWYSEILYVSPMQEVYRINDEVVLS
jgi:hypothetical protein